MDEISKIDETTRLIESIACCNISTSCCTSPLTNNQRIIHVNRIGVIRILALRVTPIFTSKKHALNTWKIDPLLRNNVMLS
jgi:hypothetical protein